MSCGRKLGRFDCCSVVQGDCLELMAELSDGCVDAVITDPPYGIDANNDYSYSRFTKSARSQGTDCAPMPPIYGDNEPFDPIPWMRFPRIVLFGANCFSDKLPTGSWLVWDKRRVDGFAMLADAEVAWMNSGHGIYIMAHYEQGFCRPEGRTFHPHQKPVAVMAWCIEKAGEPETVLDPYCGSGSTLVAAKKLGRHFLGFEISAEYCRIARERIAAVEAQPTLFQPSAAEQLTLQ